jgi:hypothetical protein
MGKRREVSVGEEQRGEVRGERVGQGVSKRRARGEQEASKRRARGEQETSKRRARPCKRAGPMHIITLV